MCAGVVCLGLMGGPRRAVAGPDWVDPLGFTPLEMTGRFGVLWMGAAGAASLLFTRRSESGDEGTRLLIGGEAGWVAADNALETDVWLQRLRVSVFLRPWMDVGVDAHGFGARDAEGRAMGAALGPSLRWIAFPRRSWQPYFAYSVGVALTPDPFPPGGTRYNFLTSYGPGLRAPFPHADIMARTELRFFHLSNGRGPGPHNPTLRAVGFSMGFDIRPGF